MDKIICPKCKKYFNKKIDFRNHIRSKHKCNTKDSLEKFFNEFYKVNENEKYCNKCGKKKKFVGLEKGYSKKPCECVEQKKTIECKLCSKKYKSYQALSQHLYHSHKEYSIEQYYLNFIGKNKCIICKKETEFLNLTKGFKELCGECSKIKGITQKNSKNYWKYRFNKNDEDAQKLANENNPYSILYYEKRYGKENAKQKLKEKINENSIEYWRNKGIINMAEIEHKIKTSSKNKLSYWLEKGYSEKDAKNKIRSNNSLCIEYWLEKGYSEKDAKNEIKKHCIYYKEYWLENGYSEKDAIEKTKGASPFSLDHWLKKGYSEKHAKEKITAENPTYFNFWLNKGYSEKQAKKEVRKYKKICKEYWLKNGYSEEESIKMAAKNNPYSNRSYSNISQELFWEIQDKINLKCLFASNKNCERITNLNENYEYIIDTQNLDYPHDFMKLDFYIPSIKKCIEFDGTYWHSLNECLKKDKLKDKILKHKNIKILRISEEEYNNNKEKTITKCLKFINEK